jgi:hypothetical protein
MMRANSSDYWYYGTVVAALDEQKLVLKFQTRRRKKADVTHFVSHSASFSVIQRLAFGERRPFDLVSRS